MEYISDQRYMESPDTDQNKRTEERVHVCAALQFYTRPQHAAVEHGWLCEIRIQCVMFN